MPVAAAEKSSRNSPRRGKTILDSKGDGRGIIEIRICNAIHSPARVQLLDELLTESKGATAEILAVLLC